MGLSCRSIAQPGGFGLEVTSESVSRCWCVMRETSGRGRAGPAMRMRPVYRWVWETWVQKPSRKENVKPSK